MSLAFHYNLNRSMGTVTPLHGTSLMAHRQFAAPLPHHSASAQQALDAALGLLTVTEEYIDDYVLLHNAEITDSPTGRAETEESVAWMRSSLNDITATIIGIATHPAP